MLYGIFVFFMIVLSGFGIIHMCVMGSYTYIIFPISTLVWGLYKYFRDNDDEYCRRNNIEPGMDIGWLIGMGDDNGTYGQYGDNSYYNGSGYTANSRHHINTGNTQHNRYQYSDPEYKKILPRCRRNSMVTTDKVKTKNDII